MASTVVDEATSSPSFGHGANSSPNPGSGTAYPFSRPPAQRCDSEPRDDTRSSSIGHRQGFASDWNITREEAQMAQDPRLSIQEIITTFHDVDGGTASSSMHRGKSPDRHQEQPGTSTRAPGALASSNNDDDDARSTTSSQDSPSPGAYDARFYPPFPGMSDWQIWMRTHPDSDWRVPSIEEFEEWSSSDPDQLTRDADGNEQYTYNRFRVWREAVNFRYKGRASLRRTSTIRGQADSSASDEDVSSRPVEPTASHADEEQEGSSNSRNGASANIGNSSAAIRVRRRSQFSEYSASENEPNSTRGGLTGVLEVSSDTINPPNVMRSTSNGSTSRPLPSRPQMRSQARDIVIPRWQPDAEATLCPICRIQFSFFVRKHHCRKCGRVVCSGCSPHRITIPYQYIVQPPEPAVGQTSSSMRAKRDHARAGSYTDSGGESVRICNPCVPDPNTTPPPQNGPSQLSPVRSRSASNGVPGSYTAARVLSGDEVITPDMISTSSRHRNRPTFGLSRSRSNTVGSNVVNNASSPRSTAVMVPSPTSPLQPASNRTLSPRDEPSTITRQAAVPRRRRILEADICPICHIEIPGRTLPNADALKEAHIANCIEDEIRRFASGSTTPVVQPTTSAAAPAVPPLSTRPLPRIPEPASTSTSTSTSAPHTITTRSTSTSTITPTASTSTTTPTATRLPQTTHPTPSTPHSRTLAREQAHAAIVLSATQPPAPTRRIDSILYTATEKDCVDDAECTICLEEFEVGVRMRRLDCFCRFHVACIDGWLERNRSCPVHQHGPGF